MKQADLLRVATLYGETSAEYVVAHAAWRRSRGRNPSMSYCDFRNAREALKRAQWVISMRRKMIEDRAGHSAVMFKLFLDDPF